MCAAVLLVVFLALALADSIHYRSRLAAAPDSDPMRKRRSARARCRCSTPSWCTPSKREKKTYSAPLAYWSFQRETTTCRRQRGAPISTPAFRRHAPDSTASNESLICWRSVRCVPPKSRRGNRRTSLPSTSVVSRWNDQYASGAE